MRTNKVILLESRLTEIEDLADSIPVYSASDIIKKIEEIGFKIVYKTLKNARGQVDWTTKEVSIDREKAYGRGLNFVLAHELGHILLNHAYRATERFKNRDGHHYSVEFEQEANFFAAYLLVPRNILPENAHWYMKYDDEPESVYNDKITRLMEKCLGSRTCVQNVLNDHIGYAFGNPVGIVEEEAA